MTDEREAFEAWFKAVEEGDGEIPLPTPADGKRWDEYVLRHALAWGAWQARAALPQQAQAPSLPPQGASSHAWRNPLNRSAWVDAVAVASFAPMTGKVVLDARVVLEANSLLSASPAPAPQEPAAEPDHELKTWPPFFEDVLSGRKTFEVRKNDRGFAVGHVVRLNEWAPGKGYTGRFVDKRITYMLTGPQFGIEAGYSVLALYASPAHQEPARPDILEKLTYHQHERDDLTLDECLEVLASGYRKVHGRTDRQMVMQILALLAASPAPGELGAVDAAAGWISVDDRMPEPDSGEVLVWLSGGRCAFDEWHMHREDPTGISTTYTMEMGLMWRDYEFEDITHWMPLPQPPQQAPSESIAQGSGGEKA